MDVTFFLNKHRSPWWDMIMIPMTQSCVGLLLSIPVQKILVLLTTVFSIKTLFQRKRPYEQNPLIHPFERLPDASFPSAHTAISFCKASLHNTLPAYLYAILMGVSRMYGGMHHASDVAAGAFIGWQICKTSNPTGRSS